MSLVLNTNSSSYLQVSNDGIGKNNYQYPDFSGGSILLFLGYSDAVDSMTVGDKQYSDRPTYKNVNGTIVNFEAKKIIYPHCNLGTSDGSPYGLMFSVNTQNYVRTRHMRFGSGFELNGGEIIGKRIYGQYRGRANSLLNLVMKIQLLHSDGTLTDIATPTLKDGTTSSLIGEYYADTNGVVAQAGDIIVVDLTFGLTSATNTGLSFGCEGGGVYSGSSSGNLKGPAMPVQISID